MKKYEEMERTFRTANEAIKETESAVSQIQSQGARAEMEAMNSAFVSMQLTDMINQPITTDDKSKSRSQRENELRNRDYLRQQRAFANFEHYMKSAEVQRLSAQMQTALTRRSKAFQDLMGLQSSLPAWYQEKSSYVDRFWEFFDLDGSNPVAVNEALISILDEKCTKIPEAIIVKGLLQLRNGDNSEAMKSFDDAYNEDKTKALHGLIHAGRSLAYADRDDKKKSKSEMNLAMNANKANPKVRWIRFINACDQGDNGVIKSESEFFRKNPSLNYLRPDCLYWQPPARKIEPNENQT